MGICLRLSVSWGQVTAWPLQSLQDHHDSTTHSLEFAVPAPRPLTLDSRMLGAASLWGPLLLGPGPGSSSLWI